MAPGEGRYGKGLIRERMYLFGKDPGREGSRGDPFNDRNGFLQLFQIFSLGNIPLGKPESADEPRVARGIRTQRCRVVTVPFIPGQPSDRGLDPKPIPYRFHGVHDSFDDGNAISQGSVGYCLRLQ